MSTHADLCSRYGPEPWTGAYTDSGNLFTYAAEHPDEMRREYGDLFLPDHPFWDNALTWEQNEVRVHAALIAADLPEPPHMQVIFAHNHWKLAAGDTQ